MHCHGLGGEGAASSAGGAAQQDYSVAPVSPTPSPSAHQPCPALRPMASEQFQASPFAAPNCARASQSCQDASAPVSHNWPASQQSHFRGAWRGLAVSEAPVSSHTWRSLPVSRHSGGAGVP